MKFSMGKHGLTCDPRHAHVTLEYRGRTLIGEVLGANRDPVTGNTVLDVRHMNGENWPICPLAVAVNVLER